MAESTTAGGKLRFAIMMFLQFFIWGVWFVPMWNYLGTLGFSSTQVGAAYGSTAIAALISPFIAGLIADRFLPTQVVLGVLHLVGGVFLYLATKATDWGGFYPMLLLHTICYMPTLALVNSVCFQNMADPKKEFPPLRTLGTIGWIVAGLLVGSSFLVGDGKVFELHKPVLLGGVVPEESIALGATKTPFLIGAVASIVLGLFSFFLPHTPPQLKGQKISIGDLFGVRAFGMLKDRSFLVFTLCSFLVCIPLAFYYQSANGFLGDMKVPNTEAVMTLGQMSEIFFLLLVPFFFRRLGVKWMLAIGMLCWALRYFLFAQASPDAHMFLYVGVLLHGICYDFFFVTGQLYVDDKAPKEIRSSAQGFIALVTLGLGMLVGNFINGWWNDRQKTEDTLAWDNVWMFPAIMAVVVLLLFILFFHEKKVTERS